MVGELTYGGSTVMDGYELPRKDREGRRERLGGLLTRRSSLNVHGGWQSD